jgi:hypothetical protein
MIADQKTLKPTPNWDDWAFIYLTHMLLWVILAVAVTGLVLGVPIVGRQIESYETGTIFKLISKCGNFATEQIFVGNSPPHNLERFGVFFDAPIKFWSVIAVKMISPTGYPFRLPPFTQFSRTKIGIFGNGVKTSKATSPFFNERWIPSDILALDADRNRHPFRGIMGFQIASNPFFNPDNNSGAFDIFQDFKLLAHDDTLSSDNEKHKQIQQRNGSSEYHVTLKPQVGLWHYLDSLNAATRLIFVVIGIGVGGICGYWGVDGDEWKRFALGCCSGAILFLFGWGVLVDWLLRNN